MSKGEEKIAKILKSAKITFYKEISFQHLTGKKKTPLRFDFGIYDNFGKLVCLIEYDGEQHFLQNTKFHKTLKDFKSSQERDRKKNNFALAHRIPLYRIPYWELESLTFNNLFSNDHLVKTQYHNDILRRQHFNAIQ